MDPEKKLHGDTEDCFVRKFYPAKLLSTNPQLWASICFQYILFIENVQNPVYFYSLITTLWSYDVTCIWRGHCIVSEA
jgi:hypothetical protein